MIAVPFDGCEYGWVIALRVGAVAHFVLVGLNLGLARWLNWKPEIERMSPLVREVFQIHSIFLMLVLTIWGVLTWRFAEEMILAPTEMSRWLGGALMVFWGLRTVMQWTHYSAQAEWDDVTMIHYAVKPEVLQPSVPFELDAWEGQAFVSAVAFTLRGMTLKGALGWLSPLIRPFVSHPFLNLRTYVRHGEEPGIYFLAEWVPWVPTLLIARPMYGLPYRPGRLRYRFDAPSGRVSGRVRSDWGGGCLNYEGTLAQGPESAESGGLTEFLMERYTAFTRWKSRSKRFRVWHPPWPQQEIELEVETETLLVETGAWAEKAQYVTAHASPGLPMVWMGAPEALAQ